VVSIIEGEHRRGAEHYGDATPAERLESEIWRVCPRITVPQMNAIKAAAARYGRAVVHLRDRRGEPTRRDYADLTQPDGDGNRATHDNHRTYSFGAEVHQASGMLMVQLGVSIEIALARLRAYAFAQGRPVSEIAREVVAGTLLLER